MRRIVLGFVTVFVTVNVFGLSVVRSGATLSHATAARDQFRADIGGGTIAGTNGSFGGLRREINWDDVPDAFAAPNNFPANYFNLHSPRGVVFSTPGTGFQLSASAASGTPVRFGNIDPSYSKMFVAFSPERLFAPLGSTVTDVRFFLPGTNTPATVSSFGAMFSDVDYFSIMQFFGPGGLDLGLVIVPPVYAGDDVSFAGILSLNGERIERVHITSGHGLLTKNPSGEGGYCLDPGGCYDNDHVALDDLIYSEPAVVAALPPISVRSGAGFAAALTARDQFRADIGGGTMAGANGSFGGLRREINWDDVPNAFAAPNNLPANFFNVNSPRGVILSTSGTGFQVSATAASGTPVRFGNIDPAYPAKFVPFLSDRLFTPLGPTQSDLFTVIDFFLPGTNTAATVSSFGVMFSDVDTDDEPNLVSIQLFAPGNKSIGTFIVPPADHDVSFVGISFLDGETIAHVRIRSGTPLRAGGTFEGHPPGREYQQLDLIAMADFIYSEPVLANGRGRAVRPR